MLIASQSSDTVQTEDNMSEQVIVNELPNCDTCKMQGKSAKAEYDAKTYRGPWAYMCEDCWSVFAAAPGKLGTGVGQRLVCRKADPEDEDEDEDEEEVDDETYGRIHGYDWSRGRFDDGLDHFPTWG